MLEKINISENERVEFKQKFSKEVIETIVAFSNSNGGAIYIGIDDYGNIIGTDIGKETFSDWYNQIKQSTEPSILVDFTILNFEKSKEVAVINVSEFPIKPVSTKGRAFKRLKNSNHLLSSFEFSELYLLTYQRSWDSYLSTNINSIDDLDENIFKQFLKETKKVDRFKLSSDFLEALNKLKLVKNGRPTNAAEILFSDDHLYFTRVGKFKDGQYILDDKKFTGNILTQLEDIFKYILDKIEVRYELLGNLQRNEIWEYPLDVIREILVNAIVHRNYQLPVDIQIKIFPEKITFFNPGRFYAGLTVDDIKTDDYQSRSRNLLISEIFYLAGKIEKYGSGFIRIRKSLEQRPGFLFNIEESGDGVLVTLKKVSSEHKEVSSEHKEVSSEHKEVSSEHKEVSWVSLKKTKRATSIVVNKAILDFCSTGEKTLDEISEALGRSKDTIRTHYLNELIDKKLINLKYPEIKTHPDQKYFVKRDLNKK